jgi:hypothetical protein
MYVKIFFFKFILCLCLCTNPCRLLAQEATPFFKMCDTINRKRVKIVCFGQGGIWGSSLIGLNKAWYANYPRSSFHFFNDIGEWNQVDKVGHAWSAYFGAQLSSQFFRWSGISRKRAALYGAGMGISYVSVIEILDGFSKEWGFSAGDMIANTAGSSLFALQEIAWEEQRMSLKFSFHRMNYLDAELLTKANQLYGKSFMERTLKDYNGQTYWLSANVHSFMKESKIPRWLNVAVGYGADGIYGGYNNFWTDAKTGIYHNRQDVKRTRQFYLAPDIDLSKIKIKGKMPNVLKMLNGLKLKFPMPAIELSGEGKLRFHAIYF